MMAPAATAALATARRLLFTTAGRLLLTTGGLLFASAGCVAAAAATAVMVSAAVAPSTKAATTTTIAATATTTTAMAKGVRLRFETDENDGHRRQSQHHFQCIALHQITSKHMDKKWNVQPLLKLRDGRPTRTGDRASSAAMSRSSVCWTLGASRWLAAKQLRSPTVANVLEPATTTVDGSSCSISERISWVSARC
jgi:hypothetical protein